MTASIAARFDAELTRIRELLRDAGAVLAYLFGSVARGQERADSDLDLAVLLDERIPEKRRGEIRLHLTTELVGLTHTNDVDVVILNEAPPLLADRVVRTGKLILGERPDQFRFEIQALKRFIDTIPLRRYIEKRLLERIGSAFRPPTSDFRS